MKRSWFLILGAFVCILLQARSVFAEPWLAQRFAQNCTACHAPGRVNKPFKDKRFSLSCESCHENPNGGGLRNHYGKWVQDRWLRSHVIKNWITGHKPSAPISEQTYATHYPKPIRPKGVTSKAAAESKPYEEIKNVNEKVDEAKYSPKVDRAHLLAVKKDEVFELYIPKQDPYWKEKRNRFQAGGDLKYYLINSKVESNSDSESLMTADVGLSFKVLKKPNLKLVFEYRYLSDPIVAGARADDTDEGLIRSAYLKLDDMAYNTYVMGGIYRPMFGLYMANPFSLRESMVFYTTQGAQQAVYDGLTYGGSPGGVPFFNVSLLTGATGVGDESKGYIINVGSRFVTYGLNFMASFWSTEKTVGPNKLAKQMLSVSGGFNLENQWMGNLETVFYKEDTNPSLPIRNSGYVSTIDLKRKLWKEYYLNANVAWSNTARDFTEGRVLEYALGVKAYILANFEMELLYTQGTNKMLDPLTTPVTIDYNHFLLQTHLFW